MPLLTPLDALAVFTIAVVGTLVGTLTGLWLARWLLLAWARYEERRHR